MKRTAAVEQLKDQRIVELAMSKANRNAILYQLAAIICNIKMSTPIRVAIDGRTASGKTTFANELATEIKLRGRKVIRTSIDGFHKPKAVRYARGRYSAEGYYFDARDLAAVRALLLDPLGPCGDRRYRTASFDLDTDTAIEQPILYAQTDSILIVDGTFLQRPELLGGWDVTVFLDTSEDVSEQRGVNRDANHLGGREATRRLYAQRYRGAFDLYNQSCQPRIIADAVLENDDLDHPRLHIRPEGRLSTRVSKR